MSGQAGTQRLCWALVAAALTADDDARETLLGEIADLETALAVVNGLAVVTAGMLTGQAGGRDAALASIRHLLLTLADPGGPR